MPCHAAIAGKLVTVTSDQLVEDVLKAMKKAKVSHACVVDKDGALLGLFSYGGLIRNIMPVSVPTADGLVLDVKVRAAPGIAKRLQKAYPLPVEQFMERKVRFVNPETPIWEGVSYLIQYGAPLLVVDTESNKPMGFITEESALAELERMKD